MKFSLSSALVLALATDATLASTWFGKAGMSICESLPASAILGTLVLLNWESN